MRRAWILPLIVVLMLLPVIDASASPPGAGIPSAVAHLDHRISHAHASLRGWHAWQSRWAQEVDAAQRAVRVGADALDALPSPRGQGGMLLGEVPFAKLVATTVLNDSRAQLRGLLNDPESKVALRQAFAWEAYLAALRSARHALLDARSAASVAIPSGPGTFPNGWAGITPPPTDRSGAAATIHAATSVLGVPYVFDAADPTVGFDCSGLTMWAWAHAGVALPHNAAMQYAVLPHVDPAQIQPGDLLFFHSPIDHVAMYLGHGLIIQATHPGPGGEVHIDALDPVWGPLVVGAARP